MDENELTEQESCEPDLEQTNGSEQDIQSDESAAELERLRGEIGELNLKLALLVGGASPERLDEGMKLAKAIASAGEFSADDAAGEILREYPHIRLAKRAVPRFSAEGEGKEDGFAAIRGIFARK